MSPKGSVRFLDYDSTHRAQDVLAMLSGGEESTCLAILNFLRTGHQAQTPKTYDLSQFLNEITRKRFERIPARGQPHISKTGFAVRVLAYEAFAARLYATEHWRMGDASVDLRVWRRHTGEQCFRVFGEWVPVREFNACRRRLMGSAAAVLSKPMGLVFGDVWLLPYAAYTNVVYLVRLHIPELQAGSVCTTLDIYRGLQNKEECYSESLFV